MRDLKSARSLLMGGIAAAVVGCAPFGERAFAANYVNVNIPGAGQIWLAGVNRKGQVAGNVYPTGFLWSSDGTVEFIHGPQGENLDVSDLNEAGEVVATFEATNRHAFLRTAGKRPAVNKIDPPFSSWASASGINARGDVAGDSSKGNYIRAKDGTYTYFKAGFVCDINDSGVVAGTTYDNLHGFVRTPDGTVSVFDLPTSEPMPLHPGCIDSQGNVAGTFYDSDKNGHAFIRKMDGSVTMIEPPGSTSTSLQSIDRYGYAVGTAVLGTEARAFIYKPDGSFRIFQSPFGGNIVADYSDGRGHIVGSYALPDGISQTYLRTR